ncbi:uncharacterized protein LOC134303691 [Trichomycterus rosablanca]|uniref:uncharacterized protein LOC134303691 n=1 Tax=Trichomycterus rosablanca TaxID=2290929 RepID=UPI002F357DE3
MGEHAKVLTDSKQMAWSRTSICLWLFLALFDHLCCFPLSRRRPFTNSLQLTRTLRTRVNQLLLGYKLEYFADQHFEHRTFVLASLPSATMNYRTWLQMQDAQRLSGASRDLQIYWRHLELQLQKMNQEKTQGRLCQSMLRIQLDLRDLMRQVNAQLAIMKTGATSKSTSTSSPTTSGSSSTWASTTFQIRSSRSSGSSLGSTPDIPKPVTAVKPSRPGSSSLTPSTSGLTSTSSGERAEPAKPAKLSSATLTTQSKARATESGPSRWVSRLEGYVILRDLERYLSRLVRDYALLQAKYKRN